jgi:hypothetical protein
MENWNQYGDICFENMSTNISTNIAINIATKQIAEICDSY